MSINLPDIVQISKLNEKEREKTMSSLFSELLKMPDKQKLEILKNLLKEMGDRASDEEYINLCKTNIKVASSLPEDTLSAFLKLRMQAVSELPKNYQDRDQKLMMNALNTFSDDIKNKIMNAMK
ncbi:dehydrogenase [Acidianus brierleyi]|uniref:Dehydrogenase n=1 Tax=Acidianus brierleyi TaxID=41673 RepID=A0A2U9IC31_9CREN|nr:dehydrogenase [Acidianus brierleyi]AWR93572.1 dehydrogenase [Acidianus brierleyi]